MQTTIYIDILISMNMIVNYFILLSTAKFLRFSVKRNRLIIAAFIGAIYSLYILVPKINIILSTFIKLIMSATIVFLAFGKMSKKNFLKSVLCFYLMNFSFAGIMFCLWFIIHPDGLLIHNSVVYFNISPIILILATIISYIIIEITNKIISKHEINNFIYDVEIEIFNKKISLKAKVDTGNTLIEPFSNRPVAVVEYKYIKEIIPNNMRKFFEDKYYSFNIKSLPDNWKNKCRIIPYKVISSNGILPSFKPDSFVITINNKRIKKDVYIGVCSAKNLTGNFEMLINPQIIEH